MIRYRLVCPNGHEFESWFQSSSAFDRLAQRGKLTCADCGSGGIEKAIMAPRIARGARDSERPVDPDIGGGPLQTPSPQIEVLRKIRAHMMAVCDDVGPQFAEEARRMHDDEAPVRPIRGQASLSDAKALLDEGINILPLPDLPDDHN